MLKKSASILSYCLIAISLLFIVSCSQTKNTAFYRGWHNMNAHYNGTFYSELYLNATIKKIEKEHKDDFTKLIPLFIYTDNESAKTYTDDLDNSIKKSSIVIKHHVIMERRSKKEIPNACKWIDENYILIGKADLYKRDLFSALEAFEYVATIYPAPKTKYAGMLWKTRANNEIGSYSLSEITLDEMRTAKNFPKDNAFQRERAFVSADYYIKTNDYPQAITQLTKAITLTRNKKIKARSIFLLAQLYEKQGNTKKASMYYSMVPGLHPNYDMLFTAKINSARLYDVKSGNTESVKKQLMKMLRDDKNIEFQDQIYYALAEIANKEHDESLALSYLSKSIKANTTNTIQKALSYLKRADIYFEKTNYKEAQINYDSSITFLPKDYIDYQLIETKANSLTKLVTNLQTISLEDSLQVLAKMTEEQRNHAIDKIIEKVAEDEKRAAEEERIKLENAQLLSQNNTSTPSSPSVSLQKGLWYFYNPTTLSFGAIEFKKKWGNIKLEDNWRRSDKDQAFASNSVDDNGQLNDSTNIKNDSTSAQIITNKTDKNSYLKNIPLTPDAIAKSTNKIIDAYNNVGLIYKEQLQNNDKSANAFEELLKRYPDNKYKISNYYQLYRTYLAMNNQPKSDYYKNILLQDYPNTEYSRIIKNPDYANDVMAKRSIVEKFYTETYKLYSEGNYTQVLANCLKADTLYSKSSLMPQFAYIKALAIGRTQDITAFEAALTHILIKYPKQPVSDKAQEMLDLINAQKTPITLKVNNDSTLGKKNNNKFIFNEGGEYHWIVIINSDKDSTDRLTEQIAQFEKKITTANSTFSSKNGQALSVTKTVLDDKHQILSVKPFNGKQQAMDYYSLLKNNTTTFTDLPVNSYQAFIISKENYEVLYKNKNIVEYQAFFLENYQ
ncbi:MAG: tetratricopeptide repeat protein [Bacteroidia bacterium]